MERMCILFGGRSGEYDVSLMSAAAVIRACSKTKYDLLTVAIDRDGTWYKTTASPDMIEKDDWRRDAEPFDAVRLKAEADFVFPVLHGSFGEDGTLQGLLEMTDMPYAGCGVLASAVCMDKGAAKDIFVRNNIPTCAHMVFRAADIYEDARAAADEISVTFEGDVFVKPANAGSSIGISRVCGVEETVKALKEAARFDRRIIVEAVVDGREIEVAVVGNSRPETGELGEIIHSGTYYDYDSKYSENSGTKLVIPAALSPETREKIRELAVKAYKAADCCGFARVDFFVEKTTGKVYINEINTIPGFTRYSMFPLLMQAAGVNFTETIDKIVEAGHERYNDKNNRQALCGR